jgi:hypothetical protein
MTARTLQIPMDVKAHKYFSEWLSFHCANLKIMRAIVDELEVARQANRKKASVKAIINFLRWNLYVISGEEYKINDRYTGIYTHMIYHNFPEYREMLEKRELRST